MLKIKFPEKDQELKVLCLGAHPDDIDIGCGATILRLIEEVDEVQFYWVVFSGEAKRCKEAHKSANTFLKETESKKIYIQRFKESYFPFVGASIKKYFEKIKDEFSPNTPAKKTGYTD